MSETELVIEGVRLMLIGMSIVFAFLLLAIAALRGMSALAMRLAPEPIPPVTPPLAAPSTSGEPDEVVALIAAAIAHHRAR
jgi:oxaloacetate decarboxylase gamma subunit